VWIIRRHRRTAASPYGRPDEVARGQHQQRPDALAAGEQTVADRLAQPARARREASAERALDLPAVALERARRRRLSDRPQ
jgi:hypothetical protein